MNAITGGTVRIVIDADRCVGSGTCLALAPDLFDMDEDAAAAPINTIVKPTQRLTDAVARCPGSAITLIADDAPDH